MSLINSNDVIKVLSKSSVFANIILTVIMVFVDQCRTDHYQNIDALCWPRVLPNHVTEIKFLRILLTYFARPRHFFEQSKLFLLIICHSQNVPKQNICSWVYEKKNPHVLLQVYFGMYSQLKKFSKQ